MAKTNKLTKIALIGAGLYLLLRGKEKTFSPFDSGNKLFGEGKSELAGKMAKWKKSGGLVTWIAVTKSDGTIVFANGIVKDKSGASIILQSGRELGLIDKATMEPFNDGSGQFGIANSTGYLCEITNPTYKVYYDDGREAIQYYFISTNYPDSNVIYV